MASSLYAAMARQQHPSHRTRSARRPNASSSFNWTQILLQICFLLCTTLLTLTSTTQAYPLLNILAASDNDTINNNGTANNPSVGGNTMEDTYGRLILDVGQKTVIGTQNWVLGLILIAVGLVQVFYGFKFIRLTLILTGFISWGKFRTRGGGRRRCRLYVYKWDD